jgi:hypothetical protein
VEEEAVEGKKGVAVVPIATATVIVTLTVKNG